MPGYHQGDDVGLLLPLGIFVAVARTMHYVLMGQT
jgi:hypothetical protein